MDGVEGIYFKDLQSNIFLLANPKQFLCVFQEEILLRYNEKSIALYSVNNEIILVFLIAFPWILLSLQHFITKKKSNQ